MDQTHLSAKIIGPKDTNLWKNSSKKSALCVYPMCCTKSNPDSITSHQDNQPTKAHVSARNVIPDGFAAFLEKDRLLSYEDFCQKVMGKKVDISFPVISYCIGHNELFIIQSTDFISDSGIPRFLLKIKNTLSFEGFHCGVKCTVKPLLTNRIYLLDTISRLNVQGSYGPEKS